jgi:hypothetical protein
MCKSVLALISLMAVSKPLWRRFAQTGKGASLIIFPVASRIDSRPSTLRSCCKEMRLVPTLTYRFAQVTGGERTGCAVQSDPADQRRSLTKRSKLVGAVRPLGHTCITGARGYAPAPKHLLSSEVVIKIYSPLDSLRTATRESTLCGPLSLANEFLAFLGRIRDQQDYNNTPLSATRCYGGNPDRRDSGN